MVLLAERNAALREWLLRLVRSAGHAVECFAGEQPLLERLGTVDGPCCVVSEMELPELDPLERDVRTARAPAALVFLTSRPSCISLLLSFSPSLPPAAGRRQSSPRYTPP